MVNKASIFGPVSKLFKLSCLQVMKAWVNVVALSSVRQHLILLSNPPVPQSFWLILHSSEARFISFSHLRKTIVSQSDESDLCLSTIRSVSALSSVIGTFSPHQITPDTSDIGLIVDKHKSDSSDCDTIVFHR